MKKFLIIAAAGAALAAGVPAALAATDNDQAPAATFQPVQQEEQTPQPEQQRPDREDCPEKDGAGAGYGPGGPGDGGATPPAADSTPPTATPEI